MAARGAANPGCITVFGIWMSDGNQLPLAGETACPTYFAKRLIQLGGAGGFACRSNGHNQWSASKMNKFPKTAKHPLTSALVLTEDHFAEAESEAEAVTGRGRSRRSRAGSHPAADSQSAFRGLCLWPSRMIGPGERRRSDRKSVV